MAYLPMLQTLGANGWQVLLRLAVPAARSILAGVEGDVIDPSPLGSDSETKGTLIASE